MPARYRRAIGKTDNRGIAYMPAWRLAILKITCKAAGQRIVAVLVTRSEATVTGIPSRVFHLLKGYSARSPSLCRFRKY
jgi:hypothetical protein